MYTLTQEEVLSITDQEVLRGTDRLLPKVKDIPDAFWGMFKGYPNNVYFRIVAAMYVGEHTPAGSAVVNAGFTGHGMQRCVKAHINDINVDYDHRMAGIAYMISKIVTITEV